MELRKIAVAGLLATAVGFSGCAAALIGAGVAGGYALSKDSVTGHFDQKKARVYRAGLKVAKKMGEVTLEDSETGRIQAKIDESDVTISVKPLTDKTTELEVSARNKFKMPAVDLAQNVYEKIGEQLKKRRWWLF